MNDKPFDLDAVDVRPRAQEGVEMELIDPAGRPTGVVLIVRGTDSEAYKEKLRDQVRRHIERQGRKPSDAERDAELWELHATLIAGWKGRPLMRGGNPIEYSAANAARLLEQYDWVFEQVRRFSDKRANFLPGPSTP